MSTGKSKDLQVNCISPKPWRARCNRGPELKVNLLFLRISCRPPKSSSRNWLTSGTKKPMGREELPSSVQSHSVETETFTGTWEKIKWIFPRLSVSRLGEGRLLVPASPRRKGKCYAALPHIYPAAI